MNIPEINIPKKLKSTTSVITRFPPQPSGFLHIGHIKALMINRYFADNGGTGTGKMILRFDNTNPLLESDDFRKSIKEDIDMMGITYDSMSSTSDYFDKLHIDLINLINLELAYIDIQDQEIIKEQRKNFEPSPFRNENSKITLTKLDQLINGEIEGVVRAKMFYDSKNGAMRDPVIYRIVQKKLYPTYDFACPLVDAYEKITHVFRSIQFKDRDDQYKWFCKALNYDMPVLTCYGLVNFTDVDLSKRKIKAKIASGELTGFDDPRIPTVRGIINRGMHQEALKVYMLKLGFGNKNVLIEWDKIWAENRKYIDKISTRVFALNRDNTHKIIINNISLDNLDNNTNTNTTTKWIDIIPKFRSNIQHGNRSLIKSNSVYMDDENMNILKKNVNKKIILLEFGVAEVALINNKYVLDLCPNESFKGIKDKLSWIAPHESHIIITVIDYNKNILIKKYMKGEYYFNQLKNNEYIQIMKKGYYKVIDIINKNDIHLMTVPDGRDKNMYNIN